MGGYPTPIISLCFIRAKLRPSAGTNHGARRQSPPTLPPCSPSEVGQECYRQNAGRNVKVENVLAAVRVAPSTTEIREFPMPEISEDSALMRMEVAGICGTDVHQTLQDSADPEPRDHGPREYRLYRQGGSRVHAA